MATTRTDPLSIGAMNARIQLLIGAAQSAQPSASRRWGVCHSTGSSGLGVDGWFKTRKDAILCAPAFFHRNPIIARWADGDSDL